MRDTVWASPRHDTRDADAMMRAIRIVLGSVLMTAAAAGAEPEAVRARVTPTYATAPAEVHIEVFVPPHGDNRELQIEVDSSDHFRSSTIPLDGARAARVHAATYRGLPAGVYAVRIALRGEVRAMRAYRELHLEVKGL
jgi:hypothetical protein